jgi:TonB-dependent receptor
MKRRNRIALYSGWLALAMAPGLRADAAETPVAGAQQAAAVTGRVQNVVTGQYLNNARISVPGTQLVAFTDVTGTYLLANVPSGSVVLEVFYTGLDVQQVPLTLSAGQRLNQDIELTSVARYGGRADTVKLDPFVVSTARETDGAAIAINEQRFAKNMKQVVATDAFGDITAGQIGEFMKFLPGVTSADGGGAEVNEISLRGFPPNMTVFTNDGARLAGTTVLGDTRTIDATTISMNSISRVEVSKARVPSTRADSMSGAVNLVTKSAFERSRPSFNYQVNLTSNDQFFSLKRTPDPVEGRSFKIFPGFGFDYTNPISKNLGFVITALHSVLEYPNTAFFRDYTATAAGTGASFATPFLSLIQNRGPALNLTQRDSLSLKVDWRIHDHGLLSVAAQTRYNTGTSSATNFIQGTGTAATATVAGGTPLTFGHNFTSGAGGRGSSQLGNNFVGTQGAGTDASVRYKYEDGKWRIDAGASKSFARKSVRDVTKGYFNQVATSLKVPVRILFTDVSAVGMNIQAFDNTNREVDLYDIANYQITTATTAPRDVKDESTSGNVDLRRQFDGLAFPVALQIGGVREQQVRDVQHRISQVYTYRGINGDLSAAPYVDQEYSKEKLYYNQGARIRPFVSPLMAWQAYEKNPDLFYQTPAQIVTAERAKIVNSTNIEETISALYLQAEARLLRDRLSVIAGVRYEKTVDDGVGPLQDNSAVWVKNADGNFAHNTAGARIRRAEAGAVGSIEELGVVYTRRGYHATRSRDDYFPSVSVNFNVTENLVARASYAKAIGRPDFSFIIPNTVSNEFDVTDPNQIQGTLTTNNPGLRPWLADCYDLSLEYYTRQGGVFSASVFRKDIKDFFGTFSKVATKADLDALGFEPGYENWQIVTRINTGDARIGGFEFSINQSLQPLGGWGRHFTAFLNGTKLELSGSNLADFGKYCPESLNWGITFNKNPMTIRANWNYRGLLRAAQAPTRGPDGYTYLKKPNATLDLSMDYLLRESMFLFATVKNVFNTPTYQTQWGSQTPDYAKRTSTNAFGVIFSVGLKGKF